MEFTLPTDPTFSDAATIARVHANPGFGVHFTDHMSRVEWTADQGWHDAAVVPYGPIQLDPAAAVLHYAQEIFEGMKAYRHGDGSVWTFRPEANAARYARSATRLQLPVLPAADFLASIEALVRLDERWVPAVLDGRSDDEGVDDGRCEQGHSGGGQGEQSLYLRPFMFAREAYLGVRAARSVTHLVIASPVGPYFPGGVEPVDIWLEDEFSRAAPGGTGAAKCGGNYAASLQAQAKAAEHGCSQVLFLDAVEHRWLEELGGMNIVLVSADGELVTPETSGTILEGVTRSSVLQVGRDLGLTPVERPVAWAEVVAGVEAGRFTEIFACGTAAVITPIRAIRSNGGELVVPGSGEVSLRIRERLVDIQYGRAEDTHGWLYRLA
ncbi:branched-chain-amino-acid transaminase [Aestuariimicrobium sp. T2.26MG-19.2B]|uniref:branched-chain-amino-acid transaminase n=1 Tax=Aestuariimicrobium sp. T2.26MG-19.2B TaxID=3040679 RepID=UPI002477A662|nr:branched-chain-amino-acid transaminase [Aestuariimicrobium sp. T2.26MG-19.2B]CAI9408318.1 Branched-chain-amino-acid aminotransferase [Aestuariimicrobium sp. T2.26MG-19.2B]